MDVEKKVMEHIKHLFRLLDDDTVSADGYIQEMERAIKELRPDEYATWFVEDSRVFFRSTKTERDYEIVKADSKHLPPNSYLYVIIEAGYDKCHANIIDSFMYSDPDYIPDYARQYNSYIADAIKTWEDKQKNVSD